MKDQNLLQLSGILLPTKDASQLFKHTDNEFMHWMSEPVKANHNDIAQYVYVTSKREPKNGDKVIASDGCVWEYRDETGFSSAPLPYWANKNACRKIEFTNDSKLIADGVPAIPEKALVKNMNPLERGIYDEVNFFREFANQYSNRTVKGVDVEKKTWKYIEGVGRVYSKKDNQKGVDVEKITGSHFMEMARDMSEQGLGYSFIAKELFELAQKMVNQALQSNDKKFSLEDMAKCYDAGTRYADAKGAKNPFEQFILSLTLKQGGIEMWCEIKTIKVIGQHPIDPNAYTEEQIIKLNADGQPVIYFNKP